MCKGVDCNGARYTGVECISFAKEPYESDYILQKRPIKSLLTDCKEAPLQSTPFTHISFFTLFVSLSLPHLTPISSLFLPERDTLYSCILGFFTVNSLTHISFCTLFISLSLPHLTHTACLHC